MRHRSPPQLEVAGVARVTLLGEGRRLSPRSASAAAGSVELVLDEPVVPGTLLMVEWEDTDVLGETSSCERTPEGFVVSMKVEHTLVGTMELARLARRLLEAS